MMNFCNEPHFCSFITQSWLSIALLNLKHIKLFAGAWGKFLKSENNFLDFKRVFNSRFKFFDAW